MPRERHFCSKNSKSIILYSQRLISIGFYSNYRSFYPFFDHKTESSKNNLSPTCFFVDFNQQIEPPSHEEHEDAQAVKTFSTALAGCSPPVSVRLELPWRTFYIPGASSCSKCFIGYFRGKSGHLATALVSLCVSNSLKIKY